MSGGGRSVPVVAFVGCSGAGKTTLIEKLLARFCRDGIRAAVIKHDVHGVALDLEGKDSWRFTQAGAPAVVVSSPQGTVLFENRPLPFCRAAALVRDVDIVLVEGYKDEPLTQVGVCRRAAGGGLCAETGRFAALVTDMPVKGDIPLFSFDQIDALADFLWTHRGAFSQLSVPETDF